MTPRPCLIAAAAALALLCGCGSAPVTHFYALAPVAETPSRPQVQADRVAKPVSLVIRDVRLPQYLDRQNIVIRSGDNRLQFSEFEQWAGNLREDMMRVLAQNLGRLLESDRVIAAPHSVALQPDFRIELEVLRFERETDGRVGLAARWWLTRGSDGALLASPVATLAGVPLGADSSYDALVASMSAVYGELAQAIARSIRAREAGGS